MAVDCYKQFAVGYGGVTGCRLLFGGKLVSGAVCEGFFLPFPFATTAPAFYILSGASLRLRRRVPVEYGHRQVLVKAFVWEVVIGCGSEVIVRHRRSYGREEMIFNPLHYLSLLEQKTNALDQAAPLQGWQLPKEFHELRRQMEVRLGKRGRREYVQVLRLLETFSLTEVAASVL